MQVSLHSSLRDAATLKISAKNVFFSISRKKHNLATCFGRMALSIYLKFRLTLKLKPFCISPLMNRQSSGASSRRSSISNRSKTVVRTPSFSWNLGRRSIPRSTRLKIQGYNLAPRFWLQLRQNLNSFGFFFGFFFWVFLGFFLGFFWVFFGFFGGFLEVFSVNKFIYAG